MAAGDIVVVRGNHDFKKGNYFDGVDDYVLHDAHAIARVSANDQVGTYTARIYVDDIKVLQTILSAGDNSETNETLEFQINAAGELRIFLKHSATTQFDITQTTASMSSRKWHHVGVVQNGTQPLLYIDGLNVAATNDTSTDLTFWYDELTLTDKFAIGVTETSATHLNDFKGAIGQVKYFNLDLSAEEMLIEANDETHTRRASTLATALVFNITMEDDGITDSGSGADNGTLTGDAHYGGEISTWSQKIEDNSTGHAAEFINTMKDGPDFLSVIKRGD